MRCQAPDAGTPGTRGSLGVTLGPTTTGGFREYEDGETQDLIEGSQGGFMIQPAVRVVLPQGAPKVTCFQVDLQNAFAEGGDVPSLSSQVLFRSEGDHLIADGFNNLLGWSRGDLSGRKLTLRATVQGNGYEGSRTANLVLH